MTSALGGTTKDLKFSGFPCCLEGKQHGKIDAILYIPFGFYYRLSRQRLTGGGRLVALKAIFGQMHIECHGVTAVKTGFAEVSLRAFEPGGV